MTLSDFIQKAAKMEATPALSDYWGKQYEMFLGHKFHYDPETEIGSIDLMQHLTSDKKDIDHQDLQQTIAVLVRFLDAVTEDLDYRSIKLSVANFEEFLKITDTVAQIGVDYVGGLIADFSYRASENLAHEKGAFAMIKNMPKQIRPVEYEMWVDSTDSYKNGQELSTMFDNSSIGTSSWTLVPRRNQAILDLPSEPAFWDKWRDSYILEKKTMDNQSLPEMSVQPEPEEHAEVEMHTETPDISNKPITDTENMLNQIGQDISQDGAFIFDSENESGIELVKSMAAAQPSENKTESKVMDFPDLDQIKADLAQVNAPETEPEVPEFSFDGMTDLYDESNHIIQSKNIEETEKEELASELEHEETMPEQNHETITIDNEMKNETKPKEYQELVLGELVKIINAENPWFGQVYQVVGIDREKVRLAGQNMELQTHVFDRSELEKQNLYELLEDLNKLETEQMHEEAEMVHEHPISMSAALILNDQNQILLSHGLKTNLPSTLIKLNQIPEESILKYLQSNFGNSGQISFRIMDEVGSVMVASNPNDTESQDAIYNIFLISSSQPIDLAQADYEDESIDSLEFVDLDDIPKDLLMVKIALDKHNRKQKILHDTVNAKIAEYQAEHNQQNEEYLDQAKDQIRMELEEKIRAGLETKMRTQIEAEHAQQMEMMNDTPEIKHDIEPIMPAEVQNHEIISKVKVDSRRNLAKFKVKLEHWIESDKFGNMALSLGYSSKGIESIALAESSLTNDVKSTINLILHLFNHLLDNGLNLHELLNGLNLQHGDNEIPVNQILTLILSAITSAPQKITEINEDWLA
jgi:hypothetical protein